MGKNENRLPIDSIGKLIKESREKHGLSIEELAWKINKPQITKKVIKKWERGSEFPDLDSIYLLAEHLNLNPNELLNKRLTIQDESIHEINPATKRVGSKFFNIFYVIVRQAVRWIAGICIIVVVANYKKFENKMNDPNDPEQIRLIETVIDNAVDDYTIYDSRSGTIKDKISNTNSVNTDIENNTTKAVEKIEK